MHALTLHGKLKIQDAVQPLVANLQVQ